MDRSRTAHAALITGFAVACLGLAAAFPKALAIAGTSVVEEAAMSVGINMPLNQIQDGQFCLAYALGLQWHASLHLHLGGAVHQWGW
jgi:hypothetical protein